MNFSVSVYTLREKSYWNRHKKACQVTLSLSNTPTYVNITDINHNNDGQIKKYITRAEYVEQIFFHTLGQQLHDIQYGGAWFAETSNVIARWDIGGHVSAMWFDTPSYFKQLIAQSLVSFQVESMSNYTLWRIIPCHYLCNTHTYADLSKIFLWV